MEESEGGSRWVRWVLGAVWAFIALAAVVLVLLWQARGAIDEFSAGLKAKVVAAAKSELATEPEQPSAVVADADAELPAEPAQVILAVGSDRRAGEAGKGRSDTTMLVRVAAGTVSMLSLPRDLRVPIPGHGVDKLNAAYAYGGMKLLITTVREYLGVRVDHFVQVDFGGFRSVVSQIGGVYLPVDGRYAHHNDGTAANNYADIDLHPGYQRLSSTKALQFVRFRHLDSDFSRAARQQLFLREVGRQLQARTHDVGSLPGLVDAIAKATTSDLASVSETLGLAQTLRSTPPDRINRVVLDGVSATLGGVSYVVTTPAQKRRSLSRWAHPGRRIKLQKRRASAERRAGAVAARHPRRAPAGLVGDGGAGARLARSLKGVSACAPTGLPTGFSWGAQSPARSYTLHGRPAGAMWATAGSGRSVLFMFTAWQTPPVLANPSDVIRLQGRDVQLFYESGRLRMVAWESGATRTWITNTLRNDLSDRALIALARSCLHA
jgi:LCP family protein required for cell wall assembly